MVAIADTSKEIEVQVSKDGRKSHKCGCVMTLQEGGAWRISSYCDAHQPNIQKKADKLIHKREKKRGRGFTKPDLTKRFLKKRRGR